jgi:hypothetical protein
LAISDGGRCSSSAIFGSVFITGSRQRAKPPATRGRSITL